VMLASVVVLCLLWAVALGVDADFSNLNSWTFTPIDFPGATRTFAREMNQAGKIVGDYFIEKPNEPVVARGFLLSHGVFTAIKVGDNNDARGINASDEIVGFFNGAVDFYLVHGYLLSRGRVTQIDYPGADYTTSEGINAEGDVVG